MTSSADPDLDTSWKLAAACRDVDPGLFFPGRGKSATEAKAICNGCPVRAECLSYALDNDEDFGVWGGLSLSERVKYKRRMRR